MDEQLQLEAYRTAITARNLEIRMFWERSNYFLVLNTAIATGFFTVAGNAFALLLSGFGTAAALLWVLVNLGSKFWQSRWEHRLHMTENALSSELELFSASWATVRADAEASLSLTDGGASWLGLIYRRFVLRKPSVTRMMTLLSVLFVGFWVTATGIEIAEIVNRQATPRCRTTSLLRKDVTNAMKTGDQYDGRCITQ